MRTFIVVLVLSVCYGANELLVNEKTKNTIDKLLTNQTKPNVYFDVQIAGFNSTRLSSGPIVLQDKKTIFISNIEYSGLKNVLSYWTGTAGPYGPKILIAKEPFLGNHTNLYISLPPAFTLDNVTFLGAGENDQELDYVIFESVNRSLIRDYQLPDTSKLIYRIPKCCPEQQLIEPGTGCTDAGGELQLNVTIFESNVTGLDPDIILDGSQYDLRPYFYKTQCDNGILAGVGESDVYGLIYNSSLIIKGEGIKAHHQFCVDTTYDFEKKVYETITIVCYQFTEDVSNLKLYLPAVIVSMICFATTAVIYRLILKENNIIKKTIIIFSSSMCLVFLSLIILNVQSNLPTCRVFGFFFLTLTIFSFIWLCISCFELFYLVKVPLEGKQQEQRWYWYIGVSSGISILILVVSLFSGELWVPDIPDTFIRHSGNCQFSVEFSRILILFVPMALSIILSLTFIIISTRLIQKNENQQEIRNNYYWVQNRYNYKFMCRTYMVIIFASLFWFAHLFYNGHQTQLALDVLEGAFGILTLTTFVLNKYTCKDIANRFKKTTHITEQTLELTDISTPTTPELEQDPFLHQNHNNHNANNSSYNNR